MKISQQQLDAYLHESLFGSNVSQVVDGQFERDNSLKSGSNPIKNKRDMKLAINSLIDRASNDSDFDDMYKKLVMASEEETVNKKIEETIRRTIRRMIKEANVGVGSPSDLSDMSLDSGDDATLNAAIWAVRKMPIAQGVENPKKFLETLMVKVRDIRGDRKANLEDALDHISAMKKPTPEDPVSGAQLAAAILNLVEKHPNLIPKRTENAKDVGGYPLGEIAAAIGYKSYGKIPDLIKSALTRAKNRFLISPEEIEIIFYQTMADYIDEAEKTNLISSNEANFLRENPDHVRELESFQQYFDDELEVRLQALPPDARNNPFEFDRLDLCLLFPLSRHPQYWET